MVFDSRAAKTLAPGAVLTVADCPGLRLLATKSGKTWTYRYRGPDDCLRQIAIGPWPELTLADAIAKWHELRALREQGVDPVERKKALRAAAKATPAPPLMINQKPLPLKMPWVNISVAPSSAPPNQ